MLNNISFIDIEMNFYTILLYRNEFNVDNQI